MLRRLNETTFASFSPTDLTYDEAVYILNEHRVFGQSADDRVGMKRGKAYTNL